MNRIILSLIFLFSILKIDAQEYFPNNESVQNKNNNYFSPEKRKKKERRKKDMPI